MEDLAYRRLLDRYYDTEKPLETDLVKLCRFIRMSDNKTETQAILDEFFSLTQKGWIQKRVQKELNAYSLKADTARANGKKGGRPKITQSVPGRNPVETQSKAKQETLNIKQEPLNKDIIVQDANAPKPVGTMLTNQQPFPIYKTDVELWTDTYPAVNIIPELKKINAWLDANPTKRKTERGMKKFINNWLSRAQDNPRQSAPQAKQTHATYTDIVNDENFW